MTTQEQKRSARRRLIGTVAEFFTPTRYQPGKKVVPPTELAIELATRWLAGKGKNEAVQILKNGIDGLLKNRVATGRRLTWDQADAICSQALSLYLKLIDDENDLDWWKRDKEILSYLTALYWQLPDRVVESREEKTNCADYLVYLLCMLKTKEVIFSRVASLWRFGDVYEPSKPTVATAFGFICDVFSQGDRTSKRKTHPDNIVVLKSYERGKHHGYGSDAFVDEGRQLMDEDKKLYERVLKEHCAGVKLKDLRPWVKGDIPNGVLQVFQEVLIRSGDRTVVLQLLNAQPVAA